MKIIFGLGKQGHVFLWNTWALGIGKFIWAKITLSAVIQAVHVIWDRITNGPGCLVSLLGLVETEPQLSQAPPR
jgi:hypothetical protein